VTAAVAVAVRWFDAKMKKRGRAGKACGSLSTCFFSKRSTRRVMAALPSTPRAGWQAVGGSTAWVVGDGVSLHRSARKAGPPLPAPATRSHPFG